MPEHLSLFKRANGKYYILYRQDGRVKWKTTGCTLKTDALKAVSQFDELLKAKPKHKQLSSFSSDFLEYAASCYSKTTTDMYERALRRLVGHIGDISLRSVNAKQIDSFKAERLLRVSSVSVNVELRTLRAAFSTAVRWGLIETNPFKQTTFARVSEKQPAYFNKEDFNKLLSVTSDEWFKQLLVVAVGTGLRRGELVNLKWKQVDFDRRLLNIQSGTTFRTKSGKRRLVPMNELVYSVLSQMAARTESEYVFTMNGVKITEGWITHKFKKTARAAGLDEGLHFHSLRHTFATWLVQVGVSIYEVQKLLGHSSVAVTQVYSHIAPSELHGAVNKITFTLN